MVLYTIALPCLAGWFSLLVFHLADEPIEHLSTTALVIPLVIAFILLILSFIFSKSSKKWFDDMIAQKVFTKETLKALPFSGDINVVPATQETAVTSTNIDPITSDTAVADPAVLLKYKELLDAGAITQEEYDQKKY